MRGPRGSLSLYKLYRPWLPLSECVYVCVCLQMQPAPCIHCPPQQLRPEMAAVPTPDHALHVTSLLFSAGSFLGVLCVPKAWVQATNPILWPPTPWQQGGFGGGAEGELNLGPPPRSPCASPTTSWKRRGPLAGASPTSLLSSKHCWNGLRGGGRGAGPQPLKTLDREAAVGSAP